MTDEIYVRQRTVTRQLVLEIATTNGHKVRLHLKSESENDTEATRWLAQLEAFLLTNANNRAVVEKKR